MVWCDARSFYNVPGIFFVSSVFSREERTFPYWSNNVVFVVPSCSFALSFRRRTKTMRFHALVLLLQLVGTPAQGQQKYTGCCWIGQLHCLLFLYILLHLFVCFFCCVDATISQTGVQTHLGTPAENTLGWTSSRPLSDCNRRLNALLYAVLSSAVVFGAHAGKEHALRKPSAGQLLKTGSLTHTYGMWFRGRRCVGLLGLIA